MPKTLASLAIVACLSLLTACSGSEPAPAPTPSSDGVTQASAEAYAQEDPATIVEDVQDAMGDMEAAHVAARLSQAAGETALDADIAADGSCAGTIGFPKGSAEFISVDEEFFIKGDEAFWAVVTGDETRAHEIVKTVGDKWAQAPSGGDTVGHFCDLEGLKSSFASLGEGAALQVMGTVTHDGLPAVEVGNAQGVLTVAASSPHYVLRVEAGDASSIQFSSINEVDAAEAPPAADVAAVQ